MLGTTPIEQLARDRFSVAYRIEADGDASAAARARGLCVEQTIEFPAELVGPGDITDHIIAHVESVESMEPGVYRAEISFAVDVTGCELPQLLSVLFGNSSLQPGVRVTGFEPSQRLLAAFQGPRFGIPGLRELLGVHDRPILCTALKPMGLPVDELADLAYRFALSGIDIIKDDHGLANQPFSPYRERVERCADAVQRANERTGGHCLYAPSLVAPADQVVERAHFARDAGAGALLVAPGLIGFDTVRMLRADDRLALPLICHPALLGSFVAHPSIGIAHGVLFGQLARLAGADATIFPSYGGRFSFSERECREIIVGATAPMGSMAPIFPGPAGGMSLGRVPELAAFYGPETMLVIGGDLHRGGDVERSGREFVATVERCFADPSMPTR